MFRTLAHSWISSEFAGSGSQQALGAISGLARQLLLPRKRYVVFLNDSVPSVLDLHRSTCLDVSAIRFAVPQFNRIPEPYQTGDLEFQLSDGDVRRVPVAHGGRFGLKHPRAERDTGRKYRYGWDACATGSSMKVVIADDRPTRQPPLLAFGPERRRGSSDLERASETLAHAVQYLLLQQIEGRRKTIRANREAVAILCAAAQELAHEERRKPARRSIAAWLRGASLVRASRRQADDDW